ncbi:MAG: tRNA (adenosine(37)-N6)-threonylcarbamoyltransferase complex dimerization subunit type 1 TsaB [Cyanobacteria bacterium J06631_6]
MPVLDNQKYAIALHTSTPQLGIAVNNYAGDSRSQTWDLGRGLASQLHKYLAEILRPQTWQDIEFIAVARGPGGFTGTRVGVVTARTIAQQLKIPLFGISNLAAIAFQHPQPAKLLAVQMDARRDELFTGIYQVSDHGLITLQSDTLMTQDTWQTTLAKLSQPYELITAEGNIATSVTNVLDLAYAQWQQGKQPHWSEVIPYYGQHPVKQ